MASAIYRLPSSDCAGRIRDAGWTPNAEWEGARMPQRLSLPDVNELSRAALIGAGTAAAAAETVARSIVDAEAEGIRNVGLGYLPIYCEHARCGKVDGHAAPTFEQVTAAAIRADAANGFSHPAFALAEGAFVALAKEAGIAALGVTRSASAGVVGWFVDRLARAGLVNLAFANSSPLVAPFGGRERFFGTNPLGFGAPRASGAPLVVDMSTSATAYMNVAAAAARGESIPLGWALDVDGNPTTDPEKGIGGSIAPLGGYKGTGLAIMVDVLAAAVTGSHFSHEASSFVDNEGGPVGVGQLFVGIAPERLGGGALASRLDAMLAEMCLDGDARVPGERRHAARHRAERDGVEVDDELIRTIEGYCE